MQTSTLTVGLDNITPSGVVLNGETKSGVTPPGAGDDVFYAAVGSTLSAFDVLDGGGGTNTLKVYGNLDNATGISTATLRNIQVVENYTDQAFRVADNANVLTAWQFNATGKTVTGNVSQKIGFSGTGVAETVTFTNVTGSADSATIAVKNAGTKTTGLTSITVGGIETLTVETNGASFITNLVAADAENIVFTGDGSVTTTLSPSATVLKSVNATANTGGVTVTLTDAQFGSNPISVSTGSGNDTVSFTDALGAKATISLGSGDNTLMLTQGVTGLTTGSVIAAGSGQNDTLVLNVTTTAIDVASGKMISGFEHLTLKGASSYVGGRIAGIVDYRIESVSNSTCGLTNLTHGARAD